MENLHAAVWVRRKHETRKVVIQAYSVNIRKSIRLRITMWANSEKFLTKMSTVCQKKKTPTFCDRLFLFSLTCIRYTPVPFSTFKLFKHFTCSNNSGRPKSRLARRSSLCEWLYSVWHHKEEKARARSKPIRFRLLPSRRQANGRARLTTDFPL